ncbi:uncharacterized protein LOC123906173 isoform X3 [Trifolium pratense]|uniref:uncharacterized protein LOC123906173 isoform X3 n=1 Tax=Trifolium pratense TaxID=57577 RepID=UPI001E690957|nr:uncharacterized protein LOC123906173 isoform X3 [Trifolium pratense]
MLRLFMLVGKLLMMVHLSCRKLPPVCIISRYFPSNFFMNSSSLKSWLQRPTNLTCLERIEIAICPDLILPATMNMLTSLCQVRIYDEDKNGTLPNFLEEKTMSLWKKSKQFLRRHQDYYHSEDESDNIIDDDLDLN